MQKVGFSCRTERIEKTECGQKFGVISENVRNASISICGVICSGRILAKRRIPRKRCVKAVCLSSFRKGRRHRCPPKFSAGNASHLGRLVYIEPPHGAFDESCGKVRFGKRVRTTDGLYSRVQPDVMRRFPRCAAPVLWLYFTMDFWRVHLSPFLENRVGFLGYTLVEFLAVLIVLVDGEASLGVTASRTSRAPQAARRLPTAATLRHDLRRLCVAYLEYDVALSLCPCLQVRMCVLWLAVPCWDWSSDASVLLHAITRFSSIIGTMSAANAYGNEGRAYTQVRQSLCHC